MKLNPVFDGVTLPSRIKTLPVGPNGFPVPYFVAWADGKPEFRAADARKFNLSVTERRCWVCGDVLGKHKTFVIGPMCGVNRVSSEPPSHTDCARFSAKYCPFLARPQADRREGNFPGLAECPAGHMITRNPGVTLLWTTEGYTLFKDGRGGVLIHIGDPTAVEWWREGRAATRAEVEESIRTGLPELVAMAESCKSDGKLSRKNWIDWPRGWSPCTPPPKRPRRFPDDSFYRRMLI